MSAIAWLRKSPERGLLSHVVRAILGAWLDGENPKDPLNVPKAVRLRDRAAAIKGRADALLKLSLLRFTIYPLVV